jgi:hypothetical protein
MTAKRPGEGLEAVWRFVRGDTTTPEFESWLYASARAEAEFSHDLYFDLIAADYGNVEVVDGLKRRLTEWAGAHGPLACRCVTLSRLAVVDMGADHRAIFESLDELARRGEPFWWLSAYACRACGEAWLVAQEELHNDVFCMRRLNAGEVASIREGREWPRDFDRYEALLRIGLEAGRRVGYGDPSSRELRRTVEVLAAERPGIRVTELAVLLNLTSEHAAWLARIVVGSSDVAIELDVP